MLERGYRGTGKPYVSRELLPKSFIFFFLVACQDPDEK